MKFLIIALISLSALAASKPAVKELTDHEFNEFITQDDAGMVIDLVSICADLTSCTDGIHLKYKDLLDFKLSHNSTDNAEQFRLVSSGLRFCDWYNCGRVRVDGQVSLSSNLPILSLTASNGLTLERGRIVKFHGYKEDYTIAIDHKSQLTLLSTENVLTIKTVRVSSTMTSFKPFYDYAKTPMRNALKMIKRETLNFQDHMSKMDRNLDHFERFIVSLEDALMIIEDKKNYSILDWRVQEGMRRVVSFGMIISDLLWAYEDVPGASRNIQNIRRFRNEVRSTYGWDDTLAGNVSKTTSAIMELIHYEISEIAKVKIEVGSDDKFSTYRSMTNELRRLIALINASDGGDIVTGQHVGDLMALWNGAEWQEELQKLMEAKLDMRKLVRPKLKYVLNAVMALEELIDNRRIYFDIEVIKETAQERPSKG